MLTMLEIDPPEVKTLEINYIFELHRILSRLKEIEKFLSSIKSNVFKTRLDR